MLAPTASPSSNTIGVSSFSSRCAAAASPIGPAPITATGKRLVAVASASRRHETTSARSVRSVRSVVVWQLQLSAGSEQHAPVAASGVGSPQHADVLLAAAGVAAASDVSGAVLQHPLVSVAGATVSRRVWLMFGLS